jgi:hypothetical protein
MRFIASLVLSLAFAALGTAQTLANGGTLAHFQSGGGWRTTFFLFNTGTAASQVQLNFYNNQGQEAIIPLSLPQVGVGVEYPPAAQFNYTLQPGTVISLVSDSSDPTGVTGWAQLQTGANVNAYLVFRYAGTSGLGVQEALVTPETRGGQSYVIDFDNTEQHFTSFAIANLTIQPVTVMATARDAVTGLVLGNATAINLVAMGHEAKLLSDIVAGTAATSGTVEFTSPVAGQISVLGLRFTQSSPATQTSPASYAFTSTPPILKQ